MMKLIPKRYFVVAGKGYGENSIEAFEMALRAAGIEFLNLVPVSSIIPRDAAEVPAEEGLKDLTPGQITFCVMAEVYVNAGERGSAAIATAYSKEEEHGYFLEYSTKEGDAAETAKETARRIFVKKFGKEPQSLKVFSVEVEGKEGLVGCGLVVAVLLP